jgi:hypothetical protein
MEKLGFDVPDSLAKKMAFTMEDRLKGLFEGEDIFDELGDVFADNAKKGAPAISSAVAGFLIDHPAIISQLKALGLAEEATMLETMMKEEMHKRLIAATSGTSAEVEAVGEEGLGVVTEAGLNAEAEAKGKAMMEAFKRGMLPTAASIATELRILVLDPLLTSATIVGQNIIDFIRQGIKERSTGSLLGDLQQAGAAAEFDANEIMSQLLFGMSMSEVQKQFAIWRQDLYATISIEWQFLKAKVMSFLRQQPIIGNIIDFIFPVEDSGSGNDLFGGVNLHEKLGTLIQNAINSLLPKAEGFEANIPIKPNFTFVGPGNGAFSAEVETNSSAQLGVLTKAYFDNIEPVSVPVQGNIVKVNDVPATGGGSTFSNPGFKNGVQLRIAQVPVQGVVVSIDAASMMNAFALAKAAIVQGALQMSGELSNIWIGMATNFSAMMNSFAINATSARTQVITAFLNMSGEASNIFIGIATTWSAMMNSMGPNAKSGASQVISVMNSMASKLSSLFKKIASDFSSAMNKMKSAASSAANSIVSSMNRIKSAADAAAKAVAKVGSSKAEGGVIPAATGKFFTSSREQTFRISDNPGARESVAFIPHNDPGPTLEKIARMFGGFGDSRVSINRGGVSVSAGGGSGGCIIQVFLDGKQIKGEVVSMLARNQSAMK